MFDKRTSRITKYTLNGEPKWSVPYNSENGYCDRGDSVTALHHVTTVDIILVAFANGDFGYINGKTGVYNTLTFEGFRFPTMITSITSKENIVALGSIDGIILI